LGTNYHEDVAEESHPNHSLGYTKSPYFREDIAQHVSKGKSNGTGIEIKQAEDTDDLDSHHIRN
jgi:hypothetical protein